MQTLTSQPPNLMLLLRVTPQQAVWCPHNRHHLLFHFLWYKGWHSTTRCLKVKHYSLFQSISEMSLVVKFCSYWIVFCWISKTRNIYSSLLNQYKVIQPRLAVEHVQPHTGEPLSGRHTYFAPLIWAVCLPSQVASVSKPTIFLSE